LYEACPGIGHDVPLDEAAPAEPLRHGGGLRGAQLARSEK